MDTFRHTNYAQEIIFGCGTFAQVGEAVERRGWRRLLLCTSGSAQRGGHVATLESALGERLVATFDQAQAHVPGQQVAEVLALAEQHAIDAVIALGGGSPIGLAKAVSYTLEERRGGSTARPVSPTDQPHIPVLAIPTTYAGSEMTSVYGTTQQTDGVSRKTTVSDPRIAPRLVIYDPLLTLDLPPALTAGTGINALAHCFEALYSVTRNPLSSAAALRGLSYISRSLVRCTTNGRDVDARAAMLTGAFLAGTALSSVAMALHHGVCHVLGGTAGISHGVANGIMLRHALRFNLDAAAPQLAEAAAALGIDTKAMSDQAAATATVDYVDALTQQLNVPRRLRDVGIAAETLPQLARITLESKAVRNNPRPVQDAGEIEALLQAAW